MRAEARFEIGGVKGTMVGRQGEIEVHFGRVKIMLDDLADCMDTPVISPLKAALDGRGFVAVGEVILEIHRIDGRTWVALDDLARSVGSDSDKLLRSPLRKKDHIKTHVLRVEREELGAILLPPKRRGRLKVVTLVSTILAAERLRHAKVIRWSIIGPALKQCMPLDLSSAPTEDPAAEVVPGIGLGDLAAMITGVSLDDDDDHANLREQVADLTRKLRDAKALHKGVYDREHAIIGERHALRHKVAELQAWVDHMESAIASAIASASPGAGSLSECVRRLVDERDEARTRAAGFEAMSRDHLDERDRRTLEHIETVTALTDERAGLKVHLKEAIDARERIIERTSKKVEDLTTLNSHQVEALEAIAKALDLEIEGLALEDIIRVITEREAERTRSERDDHKPEIVDWRAKLEEVLAWRQALAASLDCLPVVDQPGAIDAAVMSLLVARSVNEAAEADAVAVRARLEVELRTCRDRVAQERSDRDQAVAHLVASRDHIERLIDEVARLREVITEMAIAMMEQRLGRPALAGRDRAAHTG